MIISTRSDVTRVSPLELKHAQSSSQGKVSTYELEIDHMNQECVFRTMYLPLIVGGLLDGSLGGRGWLLAKI